MQPPAIYPRPSPGHHTVDLIGVRDGVLDGARIWRSGLLGLELNIVPTLFGVVEPP